MSKPKERIITSISLPPNSKEILEWFDRRAKVDTTSRSQLIYIAMKEYQRNHWKGNPQSLLHIKGKPPTAFLDDVRLQAKTRRAIVFLRFKVQLSYDQIARVVQVSHGFVYNICKSIEHLPNFDGRRRTHKRKLAKAFRRNLNAYQERFKKWIQGKYETVDEAFRW